MTVITQVFEAPPVNYNEIYRYMRQRTPDENVIAAVKKETDILLPQLSYRVCWGEMSISEADGEKVILPSGFGGKTVSKFLDGAEKAVLFAATVGLSPDRLTARYSGEPLRELIVQAAGAERVEALCDSFQAFLTDEYGERNYETGERFSPGYGDFDLQAQKDIFLLLECPKRIGLTLNESLLMSPSKSVTAVIGLKKKYERNRIHK